MSWQLSSEPRCDLFWWLIYLFVRSFEGTESRPSNKSGGEMKGLEGKGKGTMGSVKCGTRSINRLSWFGIQKSCFVQCENVIKI